MKAFCLILLLLFCIPVSTHPQPLNDHLQQAVVHIQATHQKGSCTGFYVGINRVLSANHCDKGAMQILLDNGDTVPLIKIKYKKESDLVLYATRRVTQAILEVADDHPKAGDEAWVYSHYHQARIVMATSVLHPSTIMFNMHPAATWFNTRFIPGQSGSPVVNTEGKVISVANMNTHPLMVNGGTSWGITLDAIRSFL